MADNYLTELTELDQCYKSLINQLGKTFGYQKVTYYRPDPRLASSDNFGAINNLLIAVNASYVLRLYDHRSMLMARFVRKREVIFLEVLKKHKAIKGGYFVGRIDINNMTEFAHYLNAYVGSEILCKNANHMWEYKDEYCLWVL